MHPNNMSKRMVLMTGRHDPEAAPNSNLTWHNGAVLFLHQKHTDALEQRHQPFSILQAYCPGPRCSGCQVPPGQQPRAWRQPDCQGEPEADPAGVNTCLHLRVLACSEQHCCCHQSQAISHPVQETCVHAKIVPKDLVDLHATQELDRSGAQTARTAAPAGLYQAPVAEEQLPPKKKGFFKKLFRMGQSASK